MPNPNVGILDEIDEQNIADTTVGADANSISIATACVSCLASWAVGNEGWACTVTVECQDGC
ncbi:plantaricin C family lantibiotic [Streptomonospora sp. PA3]|uniref:plantaricin C family lantibiotic n=1 Tax=Streptomonospora sp. PA3 TaxID=2607326 RepID=UPI0012DE0E37|nr:plantaricin C family lantibiotic [Streptomonospora sp. PA3]MUL42624.1 plantaricin C family lantibiotic [Streptomonospora sp. PA3]